MSTRSSPSMRTSTSGSMNTYQHRRYLNQAIAAGKSISSQREPRVAVDVATAPIYVNRQSPPAGRARVSASSDRHHSIVRRREGLLNARGKRAFSTELHDGTGERSQNGRKPEFGRHAGRPRRCGWFTRWRCRHSVMVNGSAGCRDEARRPRRVSTNRHLRRLRASGGNGSALPHRPAAPSRTSNAGPSSSSRDGKLALQAPQAGTRAAGKRPALSRGRWRE